MSAPRSQAPPALPQTSTPEKREMIRIKRIRRALSTVVVGAAALAVAGLVAAPASAAAAPAHPAHPAHPAPTVSFTIALHSAATAHGVRPAAVVDLCTVTTTVGTESGNALFAEGFVTCGDPDFFVSDDWSFYNSTHLYAVLPDFGTSTEGLYIVVELQTGGTAGHRTVQWCLTITDNNGATGAGCLLAAVNI